ncbi:protein NRT1/ PTR FAMILY 2.7 [Mercurialis annua]|uniref:protein NRT1/ PTR FAMILY 2.7 n=1 Tax=Mercurialis annua TaxID=3986 RepID=UPI00215EB049|nr:protein NRT1/ PTR FAMILY 2.7 [Mercurialis annua]
MDGSLSSDPEANTSSSNGRKKGNWITFPFIAGAMAGMTVAVGGYLADLIVYLIKEFNFKSIDAAQVFNVVNGASNLFPIVGAILADSFFGNFSVIALSSCVSFLGLVLVVLTAIFRTLRPTPCQVESTLCQAPSGFQYTILYGSLILTSIGFGGTRYTLTTMGANQFNKPEDRNTYFNWFFFTLYLASVIAATAIVYIEENVGWAVGFGVCLAANFIALALFLTGNRFYRHEKPGGSPFSSLAQVVVATVKKRKVMLSSRSEDYYHGNDVKVKEVSGSVTKSFRFFNRAAMITEGDVKPDGTISKPWRICSVQQVEDFKTLIRIFPVWSSSIFLATPIGMQTSLTILQALAMDRHIGKHFQIPSGSVIVIVLFTATVCLSVIDRFFEPFWRFLTRKTPTPFQRIGVGHVFNVLSMAASAVVESRRLRKDDTEALMPALWLFPQLILVGIGEAFHFPGQVALYYQEFPISLRSTSTAMISLIIGIAFYLSTALIDVLRRVTDWLPDNIDDGRVDNVYWVLVVIGVANFGYYLVCAKLYTYQNVHDVVKESGALVSDK